MHAYKETFIGMMFRRHQLISGISISIQYRLQNTPKVSVLEVSVMGTEQECQHSCKFRMLNVSLIEHCTGRNSYARPVLDEARTGRPTISLSVYMAGAFLP